MRVIFTNGCFDLLHSGHVRMLMAAKRLGGILVVGLNSDDSVRKLKGDGRPLQPFCERSLVLRQLRCVDEVIIVDDTCMAQTIRKLKPSVWAKGGDYTLETLDKSEVMAAEDSGSEIMIIPCETSFHTSDAIIGMKA